MINVTKTYLPPLKEYTKYLEQIWESNQLTNNGPLLQELEVRLKEFLGVKNIFIVSNGTIALQIAIKALGLTGDIITTPFSYVATTSSIVWEGCNPVFVDIDKDTLCLDPALIEDAITPNTTAILATHVYGYPCDVERILAVAARNNLKVIYDAAHAFGVEYQGKSLLNHGDIATLSFHATKLFHMIEGGAVVTDDELLANRISYMRNFGHKGQEEFWGLGINGKNSEFHAAMGLSILPKVSELIGQRKKKSARYDQLLTGTGLRNPVFIEKFLYNHAYYPVIFPTEERLLLAQEILNENDIYPRRYFYPSLNNLEYVKSSFLPVAEDIAKRVLCLPLYPDIESNEQELICNIIKEAI